MKTKRAGLWLAILLFGTVAATQELSAQFNDLTRDVTKAGTTAAEFLSLPVGARATGMGNAYSAMVDDATAIYWNPAGLAGLRGGAFMAEYAQWLAGVDFTFAALAIPAGGGTLGIGVTALQTPKMEVTTVDAQNGTGETFSASSYAFSVSYARNLTDRFAIGGTVKMVTERIWHSSASGAAIDIGTMFVTPFKGIRLGASISNFGTKMRMTGDDLLLVVDIDPNNRGNNESNRATLNTDSFDLPLTMRIGLAGELYQTESARITLAVDALNPNNSEQYVNVGTEVGLLGDLIMFRAGYSELFVKDVVRSLNVGGGLRYDFGGLNLATDYAWESHEYFDGVHRFTLAVTF